MADEPNTPYRIRSNTYTREFIGITSDMPEKPEKNGDIFHDLSTGTSYIGYSEVWYEMTW